MKFCIIEHTEFPKKKTTVIRDTAGQVRTFEKRKSAQNWIRNNRTAYLGDLSIKPFLGN